MYEGAHYRGWIVCLLKDGLILIFFNLAWWLFKFKAINKRNKRNNATQFSNYSTSVQVNDTICELSRLIKLHMASYDYQPNNC